MLSKGKKLSQSLEEEVGMGGREGFTSSLIVLNRKVGSSHIPNGLVPFNQ